jgi:hypothetical protein
VPIWCSRWAVADADRLRSVSIGAADYWLLAQYRHRGDAIVFARCCAATNAYRCRTTNISVNSTLSRSIITHLTGTVAARFALCRARSGFVSTMIFNVVLVGTYTSVFIARRSDHLGVGTTRAAGRTAEAVKA